MHLIELGAGPTVVLIHGTPSPAADLLPLAEHLARGFRVLVPELPGYGASPRLADFDYERTGRALAAQIGPEVHAIVGFSGGGYRALHLATRCGVRARWIYGLAALATLDDAAREQFRALADMIDADPGSIAQLAPMIAARMLSATWSAAHPDDDARVGRWLSLLAPRDLAAELRATAAIEDLRPALAQLTARLHLRVGELDVACPPALAHDIARHKPGTTVEIVRGRGHALLIEDAAATIESVSSVLAAASD